MCNEYTFINKLYKNKDDIDHKILVKFYCSESQEDHNCELIEFLNNCCEDEIYESDISSYRDGLKMQLTNDELNTNKKEFNERKEKLIKKNKILRDKIIESIPKKLISKIYKIF